MSFLSSGTAWAGLIVIQLLQQQHGATVHKLNQNHSEAKRGKHGYVLLDALSILQLHRVAEAGDRAMRFFSKEADLMSWFPVAFFANGVLL